MKVTHILKREIQAPILKKVIQGFIDRFGEKETLRVLAKVVEKDARESAVVLSGEFGGNSMSHLAEVSRKNWAEDDAMVMEVKEESSDVFSFNVTKCKYAEAYKKNDMSRLGKCLSCDRDKPWTESFNSDFELVRSKTLMEGDSHCDFRFQRKIKS